jgi:hypothetical protein
VQRQMYEIIFVGRTGAALWAEFEDCQVSVEPDTTTLRTELPHDGAITGLLLRISDLRLKVIIMKVLSFCPGRNDFLYERYSSHPEPQQWSTFRAPQDGRDAGAAPAGSTIGLHAQATTRKPRRSGLRRLRKQ